MMKLPLGNIIPDIPDNTRQELEDLINKAIEEQKSSFRISLSVEVDNTGNMQMFACFSSYVGMDVISIICSYIAFNIGCYHISDKFLIQKQ